MKLFGRRTTGRAWLFSGVLLITFGAQTAAGGDTSTTIEITGVYSGVSYGNDAAWGWFNVGKYDDWQTSDEKKFDLAEARLLILGQDYTTFLGIERYPTLNASGSINPSGGEVIREDLTAKFEVYDLALAQSFKLRRKSLMSPWLGITHIRINETMVASAPADQPEGTATSRLWGAAFGTDCGLELTDSLLATGRFVIRWVKGTRKAKEYGDGLEVELSDSTTRAMYGAELGLRWEATRNIHVEGGWRYRDWQYDHGPASFSGPFVRLLVVGL